MGTADWLTLDTWITSDHHWGHGNIRQYQSRPLDHFDLMRKLWVERVGEDDDLLHLGDLVWGGDKDAHPEYLVGLPGRKRLIRGNHDKHSNDWYADAGFKVLGRGNKVVRRLHLPDMVVAFTHEPDTTDLFWDVNVHGHVHGNPVWQTPPPGSRYVNACVEATGYAPVRLGKLLGFPAGTANMIDL